MTALRVWAFIFGVGFLAVGILGYIPAYVIDGNLFGIFEVDSVHNVVHIVSGALAILAVLSGFYAKLYFQLFGIIYGIVTICGFVFAGDLFLMHVNMADNILHLVIAVIALYLGFVFRSEP